jgi:simple sugar transport system permease protein
MKPKNILTYVAPLLAIVAAFLVCAIILLITGQNPLTAGAALLDGAFGSRVRLAESLAKTVPLLLTGLSVAVAFRAGFFNIGADGQFLIGALLATGIATKTSLPPKVLLPAAILGGIIGGTLWAMIAGWLKFRRGAPEIITTIMLNYVAVALVAFSLQLPSTPGGVHGWLLEKAQSQPQSDVLSRVAQLPALLTGTTLHVGAIIALFCAIGVWWLFTRTEKGFLMRAAGSGERAAKIAGIATASQAYFAVGLCGALSGLAGALEICGATKQLSTGTPGYGYTAIAVALLANLNPLAMIPAAMLFGFLDAGGGAMERTAGIPAVMVSVITGVLICAVALLPRFKWAAQSRAQIKTLFFGNSSI